MSIEIENAASLGELEEVKRLYIEGFEVNVAMAMAMAAQEGHIEIVKFLASKGKGMNGYGCGLADSLFYASQNGFEDTVDFLLSLNAHKEKRNSQSRRSPMHAAATKGHTSIVLKLLLAGIKVDVQDVDGCTPLSDAVGSKMIETVKLLLEKGANPLKYDKHHHSPWDMAFDVKDEDVKELLKNAIEKMNSIITPK